MSTTRRSRDYPAPALEKGLDILELLSVQSKGLLQGEIAQRLERSTPELFRMLNVLERRGYLNRHADGGYLLSLKLFELAHGHPPLRRLLQVALPPMQDLAQQIRQSSHLVIHYTRRILVVAQVDSPEPMGFGVRLGANFPFRPDRASSRVLCAFQPRAAQDALVAEMIANTPRRRSARSVRTELDAVRARGYYMARSDTTPGVTDICAPIFDHADGAVAALTVPWLEQRDVSVTPATACTCLLKTAQDISIGLGAVLPPIEGDKQCATKETC